MNFGARVIRSTLAAGLLGLPALVAASGTVVSQYGTVTTITAPRPVVWANFLGINTDFTDLTNPQADPARRNIAFVNQELDLVQSLGLHWLREPIHWAALEPARGNYAFYESNLQPIYAAMQQHGMKIDYYLEGSPCWASGVCAYNGIHTAGETDTVPPMAHLGDYASALRFLAQNMPKASAWEVWNEENISGFWQRQSVLAPSNYSALDLAGDYSKLFAAAAGAVPGNQLSLGGFAYTGTLDCKPGSLPRCSSSSFFSNYPKDLKRCPAGETACDFPNLDSYPTNRVTGYGYDLLNGLALDLPAAPAIAQFHPYVDFEPGMSASGGNEDYLLSIATDFTSKLRGEQPIHISRNPGDNSPAAFRSLSVASVWAGEFGLSSQSYATNPALCNSTDPYTNAQCGEQQQANFGIRYIALLGALDVDRAFYFDLGDGDDAGYPKTITASRLPLHYGLLRVNGVWPGDPATLASPQPKPLYTALQRFLQLTGPSLVPAAAPAIDAGKVQLFCIAWTRPNGQHLLMFWAPDQQHASIRVTVGTPSATLYAVMTSANATVKADGQGVVTIPAQDELQILEW